MVRSLRVTGMRVAKSILLYILIATLVLLMGGLTGWYLYLHSKTSSTQAVDIARGLYAPPPTFSGNLGSTAANTSDAGVPTGGITQPNTPIQRLWQVDHGPVAGMAFDLPAKPTASSTDLYFVERANGYVFVGNAQTQKTMRLTNTLMPKIYEALFAPAQKGVILRSLDTNGAITTFAGSFASTTVATSSAPLALSGRYLPTNISHIIVDPKSGALFYLTPTAAAYGVTGTSVSWNGTKSKQVFSSTLANWQPQYVGTQIALIESPADDLPGYAYALKSGGALSLLFGPVPGLEILPNPQGDAFLYSASSLGTLSLYAQVGKKAPALLPIKTIAEKCVWAPGKSLMVYCAVPGNVASAHFLSDWFQGAVHTADTWWQIDTSEGTAQVFYTMSRALDVQDPQIDPTGNYIAFINGSDQSLWMLRIAP